jgi:hypothetical protein
MSTEMLQDEMPPCGMSSYEVSRRVRTTPEREPAVAT